MAATLALTLVYLRTRVLTLVLNTPNGFYERLLRNLASLYNYTFVHRRNKPQLDSNMAYASCRGDAYGNNLGRKYGRAGSTLYASSPDTCN